MPININSIPVIPIYANSNTFTPVTNQVILNGSIPNEPVLSAPINTALQQYSTLLSNFQQQSTAPYSTAIAYKKGAIVSYYNTTTSTMEYYQARLNTNPNATFPNTDWNLLRYSNLDIQPNIYTYAGLNQLEPPINDSTFGTDLTVIINQIQKNMRPNSYLQMATNTGTTPKLSAAMPQVSSGVYTNFLTIQKTSTTVRVTMSYGSTVASPLNFKEFLGHGVLNGTGDVNVTVGYAGQTVLLGSTTSFTLITPIDYYLISYLINLTVPLSSYSRITATIELRATYLSTNSIFAGVIDMTPVIVSNKTNKVPIGVLAANEYVGVFPYIYMYTDSNQIYLAFERDPSYPVTLTTSTFKLYGVY